MKEKKIEDKGGKDNMIEDKTGKADHNGIHQAEIVSQKNIFRMSSFHQKIGNFFHDDDDRTIALGETTSGPTTRLGTIKSLLWKLSTVCI